MNLVTELASEREAIKDDVRGLIERLASETRAAIEHVGTCSPVVVALDGSIPEYFYPAWNNFLQKQAVFKEITEYLANRYITATIYVIPSRLTCNGQEEKAVSIVAHTADWKEMKVLPYRLEPSGVRWAEPFIMNQFESNLFSLPYGARS